MQNTLLVPLHKIYKNKNTFKWHALLTYKFYIILLLSLQLVWNNKDKNKWSYDIHDYIHQKCSTNVWN